MALMSQCTCEQHIQSLGLQTCCNCDSGLFVDSYLWPVSILTIQIFPEEFGLSVIEFLFQFLVINCTFGISWNCFSNDICESSLFMLWGHFDSSAGWLGALVRELWASNLGL